MKIETQDYMGPAWGQLASYDEPGQAFSDYLDDAAASDNGRAKVFGAQGLFGRPVADPSQAVGAPSNQTAERGLGPPDDAANSSAAAGDRSLTAPSSEAPALGDMDDARSGDGPAADRAPIPTATIPPRATETIEALEPPIVDKSLTAAQFLAALATAGRDARRITTARMFPMASPPSQSKAAPDLVATVSGSGEIEVVVRDAALEAEDNAHALAAVHDLIAQHGEGLGRLIINGVVVRPQDQGEAT